MDFDENKEFDAFYHLFRRLNLGLKEKKELFKPLIYFRYLEQCFPADDNPFKTPQSPFNGISFDIRYFNDILEGLTKRYNQLDVSNIDVTLMCRKKNKIALINLLSLLTYIGINSQFNNELINSLEDLSLEDKQTLCEIIQQFSTKFPVQLTQTGLIMTDDNMMIKSPIMGEINSPDPYSPVSVSKKKNELLDSPNPNDSLNIDEQNKELWKARNEIALKDVEIEAFQKEKYDLRQRLSALELENEKLQINLTEAFLSLESNNNVMNKTNYEADMYKELEETRHQSDLNHNLVVEKEAQLSKALDENELLNKRLELLNSEFFDRGNIISKQDEKIVNLYDTIQLHENLRLNLEKEKLELSQKLNQYESEESSMKKEFVELKTEYKLLRTRFKSKENSVGVKDELIEKLNERINELMKKNEKIELSNESLEKNFKFMKTKVEELEKENRTIMNYQNSEEILQNKEQEILRLNEFIDELNNTMVDNDKIIKGIKDQYNTCLRQKEEELQGIIQRQADIIEKIDDDYVSREVHEDISKEKDNLRIIKDEMLKKQNELSNELETIKKELKMVKLQYENKNQSNILLKEEKEGLLAQIDRLTKKNDESNVDQKDSNERMEKLSQENFNLKKQNEEFETELTSLIIRNEELANEIKSLETKENDSILANEQNAKLYFEQIQKLKNEIENQTKQTSLKQADFDELTENYRIIQISNKQLNEKLSNYKQRGITILTKYNNLKEKYSNLKQSFEQYESDLNNYKVNVHDVGIDQLKQHVANLQQENDDLRQEMDRNNKHNKRESYLLSSAIHRIALDMFTDEMSKTKQNTVDSPQGQVFEY
eukprot:TRINITY_DN1889_c0_g1_i1.p1 TRINITY_DN1889_c0_g1~~TRINITY_DN1889_c0_g1_i1.p1  ORF type:complete len:832 (-),score=281.33 TRINITY_DN1889_c0_g1_i1:524-3019(-)